MSSPSRPMTRARASPRSMARARSMHSLIQALGLKLGLFVY